MIRKGFLPQTLEVDETIFERNLRIVDGFGEAENDPFSQAMSKIGPPTSRTTPSLLPEEGLPSIQVTPEPGLCVKTKNVSNVKVFMNVCKIPEIPPAPAISEDELRDIIANENYESDFRVPMSLGSPREEKDKSGNKCLATDVAINSVWFDDKMEKSLVFTTFVVNVAMEGLKDKYGDQVNLDRQNWNILRNKKYMGELQRHRIQQRAKGSKIQEVTNNESGSTKIKPLIVEVERKEQKDVPPKLAPKVNDAIPKIKRNDREPQYKIFKDPACANIPDRLRVEVWFPGVRSQKELTFHVGEDRIVLEARKAGYILDCFVPFSIRQEGCFARFETPTQKLVLILPVVK